MRWPEPGITLAVVMPPACAFWNDASRGFSASRMRTPGCIAAERSPPEPSPTWLCVSTSPGMSTLPDTSTTVAPPSETPARGPTATIFPPSTTSAPSAMAGPLMG